MARATACCWMLSSFEVMLSSSAFNSCSILDDVPPMPGGSPLRFLGKEFLGDGNSSVGLRGEVVSELTRCCE